MMFFASQNMFTPGYLSTVVIIIVTCNPTTQDVSFEIYKSMSDEKGACLQDITIDGNGIKDKVTISCSDARSSRTVFIPNGFILGDFRNHQLSLFTDNANSLITITGNNKECQRRTYKQSNYKLDSLLPTECDQVKEKIASFITEANRQRKPQLKGSKGINVIKNESRNYGSTCIGSIRVVGYEIDDTAVVDCAFVPKMEVLFVPHGVVIGDWRKTQQSVFTDTPNTLVVIRSGVNSCDKKIFSETPPPIMEPMDQDACLAVRRTVDQYWDHREAILNGKLRDLEFSIRKTEYRMDKGVLIQYIKIEGNGIRDQLSLPYSEVKNMDLIYILGGFILADWKTNRRFIYSDAPDSMITMEDQSCFHKMYSEGVLVKSTPIDCKYHLDKIRNAWNNWNEENKNKGVTVHRHSYFRDGRCIQDNFIEGRGVEETITVTCAAGQTMTTIFTAGGFALGDYIIDRTSAFLDSQGTWVVLHSGGRTCSSQTLTEEGRRTELLSAEMCKEVMVKIQHAMLRHHEGVFVPGASQNTEFIIVRDPARQIEGCVQNIKIKGNGIDDVIPVPCDIAYKLGLLFLRRGFVLGDYKTDSLSIFTEWPGAMVTIMEGGRECSRTTYDDGKKQLQSVSAEQCEAVKKTVQDYWNDKDKRRFWTP